MAEKNEDQLPRINEYQQRLAQFMESAREGLERKAPEALDRLAGTARSIAQRLDHMADDARQRRTENAATSSSTVAPEGATESPDQPRAPSSTS